MNVDVRRDMTRVCARVLIEEEEGGSVGNGRMMDLVGFFCPKKRRKRRARVRGKENVIRPSDDERRTGRARGIALIQEGQMVTMPRTVTYTIYLAVHDSTSPNISSPSPVSLSQVAVPFKSLLSLASEALRISRVRSAQD